MGEQERADEVSGHAGDEQGELEVLHECGWGEIGGGYRSPFRPPSLTRARARPGLTFTVSCLDRPNISTGRVVPAHGLS